tara:strand:- start:613 stop:1224 length:612 start_codon:yes stop_codon:yes gene_type:complete
MNEFLTVVFLHLFAVMSPGPDYVLISRQSIRYGRKIALWSAGGIGVGILFHSVLAATGILLLIASNDFYLSILKLICCSYLLYLGISSIVNTSDFNQTSLQKNRWSSSGGFLVGLLTNITNIKALLFFITLFGVVLNTQHKEILLIYGIYMAIATFIWFAFISFIFTSEIFRSRFIDYFKFFEKLLGVVLIMIAVQIILVEYV